jgi:hypothetical protein
MGMSPPSAAKAVAQDPLSETGTGAAPGQVTVVSLVLLSPETVTMVAPPASL